MRVLFSTMFLVFFAGDATAQFPVKDLNVVIFTADDLGADETGAGAFGGQVKGITPHIDRIAMASVRFRHAYVNTAICAPSRANIATGMYGFNTRHHGFFYAPDSVYTMMDAFRQAGYKIGILGKVEHSSVKFSTEWDYVYDESELGSGRSPSRYYERTKAFILKCRKEMKPFYFMINSADPHRPFQETGGALLPGAELPSKSYLPDEVYVPGFLPDLPEVRKEMSAYYNSLRRLDDTFGKVMQAIADAGAARNTLVIFLSDNGIAMPFAKANCYLKSTRTPLFFYLPGRLTPREDTVHLVSAVDLYPTIMNMTGAGKPLISDGRSFMPILEGKSQEGRQVVFTQLDYLYSNTYYPMRCVLDKSFAYIFNPWSDGVKTYHNNNEGQAFEAMVKSPAADIQERVDMFRFRAREELYDIRNDPACLNNLAAHPLYQVVIEKYRVKLAWWMQEHRDPVAKVFNHRQDPVEMSRKLDEVYTHALRSGSRMYESYMKKVAEMRKRNFE